MAYGVPIAAIGMIYLIAALGKRIERTWASPSVFFSLLWGSYLLATLLNVSDARYLETGYLWIAAFCGCALIGSAAVCFLTARDAAVWATQSPLRARGEALLTSPMAVRLTDVLIVIGVGELLYLFFRHGMSLGSIFDLSSMALVSGENRISFGYGIQQQGRIEWLVFVLIYLNAFLGGIMFGARRSWCFALLRGLLPLFLAADIGMLYGSRMGILFGGAFWLSGLLASHVTRHGFDQRHDRRILLSIGVLASGILIGLSILAMIVRYTTLSGSEGALRYLSESLIFVPAFCKWMDGTDVSWIDPLLGFRTFWRTYEALGVVADPEPVIFVEDSSSNIYTMFRGLLEDWGPIGACAWMVGFGIVGRVAYSKCAAGKVSYIAILALVYAYVFVGTSFSLFTYNATNLAMILFLLYGLTTEFHSLGKLAIRRPLYATSTARPRLGRW